ncbi:neutral/alkaline non-lysosomal ceramidase N-terminal domain-containing protein [Candidatus Bathyarchaeota archaeon]|nr:neutral/alkaline non-lysosomal ceramidase N-terminal domain-containing protein [Candidatus Bathyarchaeota archaeon]
MISCTHTHSGPGSMPLRVIGKNDDAYQNQLEKKIAGAVFLAQKGMKEGSIGFGMGNIDLAASRRIRWPDGSIRFDWLDPNVPPNETIDKDLAVLTVKNLERKTQAVVINYACHPVTMGGNSFNLISSDFPGVATGLIEKVLGSESVSLFLNGAFGDTHPRKDLVPGYNNYSKIEGDELTITLGTILGAEALRISEVTPTYSDVGIQAYSETVRVQLEKLPSVEVLDDRILEDRKRLEELMKAGTPTSEWWWLKQDLDWSEYLLEQYKNNRRFETYEDLEVQVIRINDNYIIGLPGEIFSHIGLQIKSRAKKLGITKVLVNALANGNPGYVPAEHDYTVAPKGKRGYELEGSYMLYGRPLVCPKAGTTLIETAINLIAKISD